MGIRDIFDNTAILTGIAKAKRAQSLIVTDIIQKAGIEVNEMGTAAYAATGKEKKIKTNLIYIIHNLLFTNN